MAKPIEYDTVTDDILINRIDREVARGPRRNLIDWLTNHTERYLNGDLTYTVRLYEDGEIVSVKEYLDRAHGVS